MNPLNDHLYDNYFLKLFEQQLNWPEPVLPPAEKTVFVYTVDETAPPGTLWALPEPAPKKPWQPLSKDLIEYAEIDSALAFAALATPDYDQMALDRTESWVYVGLLAAPPLPDADGAYTADLLSPFVYRVQWDDDLLCEGTIPAAGDYLWPEPEEAPPWGVAYFDQPAAEHPVHWQSAEELGGFEPVEAAVVAHLFIDVKTNPMEWAA